MRLCLEKPIVVGSIPPELFDPFIALGTGQGHEITPAALEGLEYMAKLVHRQDLERFFDPVIRTRHPNPGEIPQPAEQGRWHTDSCDLVVSNIQPTQFAYASLRSVRDVLGLTKRHRTPIQNTQDVYWLAEKLNYFDDETLVSKYGFGIWSAEPYEVVLSTGMNPHRTPRNTSAEMITRTVVILPEK